MTMRFSLPLPRQIDGNLAADLEKNAVSVTSDLLSFDVEPGRRSVMLTCVADADRQRVEDKVRRYLDAMLAKTRTIEPRVHFSRRRTSPVAPQPAVYDELKRRDWLSEHGAGRIGLAGPALRLFLGLDAYLRQLHRDAFAAEDRRYPTMIDTEALARCGYFESHPDAASFVSHLVGDFDTIEAFRRFSAEEASSQVPAASALAPPGQCLCPAGCFPCYLSFQGRQLTQGNAVTLLGRVFRYESRNMRGLERLWEFNMREIVFLGTQDFVDDGRRRLVDLFRAIAEEWDLDCRIETATDAFFPSVYAARSFWQEVTEVKYEIRLAIEPDGNGRPRDIAAGSINLHGPFFGERFGITLDDGQTASTGCCGWGLERWVLALFAQHGFDTTLWPSALRAMAA